jgi:hypothetical protein
VASPGAQAGGRNEGELIFSSITERQRAKN